MPTSYTNSPILFLDGGLGTSLEDKYGVQFSNQTTPLWSSDPLISDPATLLACQSDFGRVPVDVLMTATYQVSEHGFAATKTPAAPHGIARASIPRFLQTAVDIAEKAARSGSSKPSKIALSLGPYGSTMIPGQEYSGAYDAAHDDEAALAAWWADRLALFAGEAVVGRVDYVACETIPRRDEIRAVRRAVAGFLAAEPAAAAAADKKEESPKRCWISCVFPGQDECLPDGSSIDEVVETMLVPKEGMMQPWGIGINCTKLHKLESLIAKFESAVARLVEEGRLEAWPALVLYPDGTNGEVYNTTTQVWELPAGVEKQAAPWEKLLGETVVSASKRQRWSTILVGGCCKASHSDIAKLVDFVRNSSSS